MVEAALGVAVPLMAGGRPTRPLPLSHLINLSLYWLGLTAIWAGLDGVILTARVPELVGKENLGIGLLTITAAGVVMPIIVQPTMGAISDYTTTRWGRRKPYILIGALLDVLFLVAIASAQSFIALVVLYTLLQLSSNFAQGPFQGYMPDLVPATQVGQASGFIGLMIVFGQVAGTLVASAGALFYPTGTPAFERLFWPTVGLGILELTTALVMIVRISDGPVGLSRAGRSWLTVATSAWGRDVLRHRSFIWLVASRLCFLSATGAIVRFARAYLERSMYLSENEAELFLNVALIAVLVPTALSVIPASRLSDRYGRKALIYAACALGAAGLAVVVVAPSLPIAVGALVFVGIGAGAFLAVDWALMTDIIPKATSGRFMGISNVGTAMAGPVALLVAGPILDWVFTFDPPASPRAAFAVAVGFFLLAAVLLRPVDPTPRD